MDINDDGIGDTPYNITGTAKSQDNFPIWDDGPEPIPVPPPPSGGGGGGGGKDKKGEEAIHGYNLLILIGIAAIITVIITKKSREYSHKI